MGEGVTAATWMLHIACACVYLTMAVLVVARRPQAGLNWACGVLILCFFHWSACLAVSHHPSTSAATAELFYDLGALSWASFASLAVLFIAVFWRFRYLRSRWFWAALVLPPAIVIHAQWTGRLAAAYPTYPWGHGFAWRHSPQATFYIAYYALYMVGGLGALLLASFAPGPAVRRRQARVIGLSAIVPLVAGSLTDVWLPRSGSHRIPNMAPDFTLIWVVGLVYAIVRYRMLELTPAVAADRVVETMPDALFLLQPEGRIAWANPAAVQLFGHSRVELREMSLGDLFQLHPTAAAPSGARLLAAGRQDLGGRRQDGGRVDIGLSLAELRGGLGELAGWVAVATDVTSRNQAEAELRRARDTLESRVVERTEELQQVNRRLVDEISVRQRSEEHYRLLIESMHEGLWVLDPEDRTTLVNSRLAAILGCRAADLVGRKLVDFVGEDSLGACTATLKAAHLGQAGQGDWQIEAWPGRRQEVPGEDPVSGRIELGRARADDADGAGEPPADGAGHGHDGWNGALRPPRRLNAIVQISPLLGAGAGAGDGEGTDRGSGYLGAVLTVMDVTERESMRAQLSRAERLASMGLLAAGVGHEINNPLTFVIGNIEEILRLEAARAPSPAEQDAVPPGPPSPVARLADEALAGTFRVREIVRDLRRFSRAETPEVSPIDVREPIEEAIRLAHNQVRFRARLVRELDADGPLAMANRTGISQVVLNLLLNAAQAIGEGRPDDNEIRIGTGRGAGGGVVITVRDTGAGIAPEYLDRIFDPFFSTKPVSEGQGLGLAICHEIIAAAGGRITVTSAPGRGTEFVVTLRPGPSPASEAGADRGDSTVVAAMEVADTAPVASAAGSLTAAAAGAAAATGVPDAPAADPADPEIPSATATAAEEEVVVAAPVVRPRVLVIDDEDLVRRILARQLGRSYRVEDVASGEQARALIAADPSYDLIFCDMMMPGMSGMALADWIAERAPTLIPRLVFMTGGAFTARAERYLSNAANPVLEKPFQAAQLLKVARDVLSRADSQARRTQPRSAVRPE